jgi:Protein of unknown function (DUF2877)
MRASRWVQAEVGAESRGVVVGVQRRACHLALDSGALVILSTPDVALAPNGVTIALEPPVSQAETGVRVGQTVVLGTGVSARGRAPGQRDGRAVDWRVELAGASIWEPRARVEPIAPGALRGGLVLTRALVIAEGAAESLVPLLRGSAGATDDLQAGMVRMVRGPARHLRAAAAGGELEAVADAAARLAGLGPGLTPSGDDLLAGFAAAWTLVGESRGLDAAARQRVARALYAGAQAGASRLGRVWLEHALRGELPEPMTRFVAVLLASAPCGLESAVREMLAVGASSGTDWTVGFLLGAGAAARSAAGAGARSRGAVIAPDATGSRRGA